MSKVWEDLSEGFRNTDPVFFVFFLDWKENDI